MNQLQQDTQATQAGSIIHISRRNRPQGFLADNLTMYSIRNIFNEDFSLPSFYKHVFGEYNVDLDSVYDKCELERVSFEKTIETLGLKLYSISKPYQKNKLIYKYFHDIGLDIMDMVNELYERIKYLIPLDHLAFEENVPEKFGKSSSDVVKDLYIEILNSYERLFESSEDYFDSQIFRNLRLIDNFLIGHKEIMQTILPNLSGTFNNTIKNCYRIRLERGNRAIEEFTQIHSLRESFGIKQNPNTFGGSSFIQSSFLNFSTTLTNQTYTILPSTKTTDITTGSISSIINIINTSDTLATIHNTQLLLSYSDPFTEAERSLLKDFYIPKKPKIMDKNLGKPKLNKKSKGVRIFNKSLQSIRKFIPKKDLDLFLRGGEFVFKGKMFNYGFRLYNRMDLITYSHSMNSYSIKWALNIYDKETEQKLARACIVFRNCPILDNVLSVYMLLKSDQEDEILLNSGFHDKGPLFESKLNPIITALKKAKEPKIKNFLSNETGAEPVLNNLCTELNVLNANLQNGQIATVQASLPNENDNFTLDGHNRYENRMRNAYLERVSIEVEIKSAIRNWLERYLIKNGMDKDLYKYTTNLDVSWDEAVDYEAFQLFDVKVFDKWVKPLKWSVNTVESISNTKQLIKI